MMEPVNKHSNIRIPTVAPGQILAADTLLALGTGRYHSAKLDNTQARKEVTL